MKMQKYIRVILSLILILSNLSVAFSMHFCGGQIEQIKLNHLDNKVCKMQVPTSCCSDKQEVNHCETPNQKESNNKDEDCCKDLAIADELQQQQIVKVLKILPIIFEEFSTIQYFEFPDVDSKITSKQTLDFYVESNAPPIYKLNQQFIFYEV